jgi:hypothetical protein
MRLDSGTCRGFAGGRRKAAQLLFVTSFVIFLATLFVHRPPALSGSVTPKAFHVLRIGAEIVRRILVDPDDANAAREIKAAFAGCTLSHVLFQDLTDDVRGTNPLCPGFGFELLFKPPFDPDMDSSHTSPVANQCSTGILRL